LDAEGSILQYHEGEETKGEDLQVGTDVPLFEVEGKEEVFVFENIDDGFLGHA
jgi:hypothetical protein